MTSANVPSRLFCQATGSDKKPPLVLLHGFLGSVSDWSAITAQLQQEFRVVLVDLPGHGRSPFDIPSSSDAFGRFNEQLNETLADCGIKRCTLLGYSLGGRLAMSYALSFADNIDALLVESAHPGLVGKAERSQRWLNDKKWSQRFATQSLREVLEDWYQQPVFADLNSVERTRMLVERSLANLDGATLADVLEAFSLARQPDFTEMLARLNCRRIYLCGDNDTKFAGIARIACENGAFDLVRKITGAGHNSHRSQPQQFVDAVMETVAGVSDGG